MLHFLPRNDVDVNCKAGPSDYIPDVEDFFDTNKDGQFCGNEWVERRLAYNGFDRDTLEATWEQLNQGVSFTIDLSIIKPLFFVSGSFYKLNYNTDTRACVEA